MNDTLTPVLDRVSPVGETVQAPVNRTYALRGFGWLSPDTSTVETPAPAPVNRTYVLRGFVSARGSDRRPTPDTAVVGATPRTRVNRTYARRGFVLAQEPAARV